VVFGLSSSTGSLSGSTCRVSNPDRRVYRLFARGRPAGASDPAPCVDVVAATVGDVVTTAGGPAQPRFVMS
jgi:hypothetical protein